MNNYALSQVLGDRIIAYLSKQPYNEVIDLIKELESLPTITLMSPSSPVTEPSEASISTNENKE